MPANTPRNEPLQDLPGTERPAIAGARDVGPVPADEPIELTIRLRAARPTALAAAAARAGAGQANHPLGVSANSVGAPSSGASRRFLSRAELRAVGAADLAEMTAVEAFVRDRHLDVVTSDPATRRIVVGGPAGVVASAFDVRLRRYRLDGLTCRGRVGSIRLPASIAAIVEGVFGLDDRPQAWPHFRILDPGTGQGDATDHGAAGSRARSTARPAQVSETSYRPPEIAQLYDFVGGTDGSGQAIALIELGGGFRPADLTTWFASLGIIPPRIETVLVDGARNDPSTADSADGEVLLDIEIAGSIAPGATIVVYFAPNTDRGFLDAISRAIHDTTHNPSVISISWGGAESGWTEQAMRAMDMAFADAALLGVTVTCASGDDGSDDRVGDGRAHADFPASSPNVLACGGTRLLGTAHALRDEVAWNDGSQGGSTGGGISDVFDPPTWQAGANVPPSANPGGRLGRGLPDVAGDASPASGYAIRVDGRDMVFGGTSAVAPLYAALVARLNQRLGRPVGFLNPALYGPAQAGVRDITKGTNGAYSAGPGWDACTGLG
ncbi:MAG: S53 family peptidase, partial [Candidatus Limnocylindrales bacterium]